MEKKKLIDDGIHAIYGSKAFVKFKPCLGIDKVMLSFVEGSDNIDVYMDVKEFGGIFMKRIQTGRMERDISVEKAKGAQYPGSVYDSKLGGKKTDDGAIARNFTLSPGAKTEIVLTAYKYNAKEEDGKFVPQGKPTKIIRVGGTYSELEELLWVWKPLEAEYLKNTYNMENVRNPYYEGIGSDRENKEQNTGKSAGSQSKQNKPAAGKNNKPANGAGTSANTADKVNQEQNASKPGSNPPQQNKPAETQKTAGEFDAYPVLHVISKTPIKERQKYPGNYAFECTDYNTGAVYCVVIPASSVKKMTEERKGIFDTFKQMTEEKPDGTEFKFHASKEKEGSKEVIYFWAFA